jgi:rubredoxin-NAD+ reductase
MAPLPSIGQGAAPAPRGGDAPAVVIVGAGLAGWTVARELRQRAPAQAIRVVCADAGDFYSKPMLSNAFAQKKDAAQLVQKPGAAQAQGLKVALQPRTKVLSIDREARCLRTDAGPIAYESLVLALGADPIRLPTPGIEHALPVNDIDDYRRLRGALSRAGAGARVAIIGGGLIGCEFANDLGLAGFRVQIIDPAPWLIGSLVTREQGEALQAALEALGVQCRLGDAAERIDRLEDGTLRLALRSGPIVEADVAVSAVGLRPRTELAQQAGLAVARGIRVDALGRSSDPRIYALGDCAAYESAGRPDVAQGAARPLPFVLPLMAAGKAIAASLAGEPTPIRFGALPVRVKTPALPLTVQA